MKAFLGRPLAERTKSFLPAIALMGKDIFRELEGLMEDFADFVRRVAGEAFEEVLRREQRAVAVEDERRAREQKSEERSWST